MAEQPLGDALLWVVTLGMACLVVWQLAEALLGHREADGAKLLVKRLASGGKAVVYAALGWSAATTALGGGSSGGSASTDTLTARLMSAPGGTLIVGGLGLGIVVVGIVLAFQGWTERFVKHLLPRATQSSAGGTHVVLLGKVGYLAKGAALVAIGVLFVTAAVQHQPKESGGLDVALRELLQQPLGPVALALVAVGLGCFGAYCFYWARYLRR
jgi:type IV secretory pathway VirB2 component (pilin)